MKILFTIGGLLTMLFSFKSNAQAIKLTTDFDVRKSIITLNWNMVNNPGKTSYMILRSADGIVWTEAARDKILRNYTDRDLYYFEDKFYTLGKNFYRIKITNENNMMVALSPIVTTFTTATRGEITGTWLIYPNPVNDVLTLNYKGTADLKGVVNVQIMDVTGKIVIKFRSASIYKIIQIPVNNLKRGFYFTRVTVMNDIVMNKQFMKQ